MTLLLFILTHFVIHLFNDEENIVEYLARTTKNFVCGVWKYETSNFFSYVYWYRYLYILDMRESGNTVVVRRILKGTWFCKIVLLKDKQSENYNIPSNNPFTSR